MKKLFFLLVLVAACGGAWWWFHRTTNDTPEYQTAKVTRGDLTQVVNAIGTLNPVVNVTVGSQISGNISKLFVDFNSPVKAGQAVAQLDNSTYQAVVHQAEGDLANAQAALELARLTATRKKELLAQNASTKADLDTANATLGQAEATVQVKKANLERAKVDLDRCTIYSPIDGIVISRSVDVGQTVAASMNAPVLFLIANDLSKMQIDTNVAEADVGNVEVKQSVEFTADAFPYRTFRGEVAQVRNAAITVQNVVSYDVVVSVHNEDLKLKPGMTATCYITVAQREGILKINNSALRFRPPEEPAAKATPAAAASPSGAGPGGAGGPGGARRGRPQRASKDRMVYVLADGKPVAVPVKLGISDGVTTEVLEGLKEGDVIVTGMTLPASKVATPAPNPLSGQGPRRF